MDSLNILIPSQSVKYDSIIDVCQLVKELHDMGFENVSEGKKRTDVNEALLSEDVSLNDLFSIFFRTGRDDGL